jgi:hypothetical protein
LSENKISDSKFGHLFLLQKKFGHLFFCWHVFLFIFWTKIEIWQKNLLSFFKIVLSWFLFIWQILKWITSSSGSWCTTYELHDNEYKFYKIHGEPLVKMVHRSTSHKSLVIKMKCNGVWMASNTHTQIIHINCTI